MLLISNIVDDEQKAGDLVDKVIENGKALQCFRDFIIAQGGDDSVCDDLSRLPTSRKEIPIISASEGWIEAIDSLAIGYALVELGAGREIV